MRCCPASSVFHFFFSVCFVFRNLLHRSSLQAALSLQSPVLIMQLHSGLLPQSAGVDMYACHAAVFVAAADIHTRTIHSGCSLMQKTKLQAPQYLFNLISRLVESGSCEQILCDAETNVKPVLRVVELHGRTLDAPVRACDCTTCLFAVCFFPSRMTLALSFACDPICVFAMDGGIVFFCSAIQ